MTTNNFTYKLATILKNEVATSEPVTLEYVKSYMGISFANHDDKLNRLITACRIEAERFLNVTLIQSRTVSVAWQSFYDSELLPYCPVTDVNAIVAKDLSDAEITDVVFESMEGFVYLKGDYPNGIKLSYATTTFDFKDDIKEKLVRAVAMCFEHAINPNTAIKTEFRNHILN